MSDQDLYLKISALPAALKQEVIDFIDFLSSKSQKQPKPKKKGRTFGYAKGAVVMKPDFDDPLEDFKDYM